MIPLMSIRLSGESEFSKNFNYVGELFTKWQELPEGEEKESAWKQYFDAKYALETGSLNLPSENK